jgi:predicted nucleic acid-binding protein
VVTNAARVCPVQASKAALGRWLAQFEALAFTYSAALRAAQVLSDLKRRHVKAGCADVLQAGHALALATCPLERTLQLK